MVGDAWGWCVDARGLGGGATAICWEPKWWCVPRSCFPHSPYGGSWLVVWPRVGGFGWWHNGAMVGLGGHMSAQWWWHMPLLSFPHSLFRVYVEGHFSMVRFVELGEWQLMMVVVVVSSERRGNIMTRWKQIWERR